MGTVNQQQVHKVFAHISGDYDMMNDVISLGMHRVWKKELVEAVCKGKPSRVLDVCCGTGDISLALAKGLPSAAITGLDFSAEMLVVAKERQDKDLTLVNLELRQGNAMELPFDDNSFDCVVISFGLRNLPDYEKGVAELVRVVKAGGRVFCLDSYQPKTPCVRPFYKMYFKNIVGLQSKLLSGKPEEYRWLYESTAQFLSPEELEGLFKAKGLAETSHKNYLFGAASRHVGTKK